MDCSLNAIIVFQGWLLVLKSWSVSLVEVRVGRRLKVFNVHDIVYSSAGWHSQSELISDSPSLSRGARGGQAESNS